MKKSVENFRGEFALFASLVESAHECSRREVVDRGIRRMYEGNSGGGSPWGWSGVER